MLLDPENVGIAVGILLLSHILAEIYVIAYVLPAVFDLPVTLTPENIHASSIVLLDPENVGV